MRATKSSFEKRHLSKATASAALVASALLLAVSVKPCLAGASGQTTFPSPDDASRALVMLLEGGYESAARVVGRWEGCLARLSGQT